MAAPPSRLRSSSKLFGQPKSDIWRSQSETLPCFSMSNIVTQRFIKCLEKLREDGKVRSSRQFALALDYLPQSLSEIVKGRRDVTVELLRKIAEVYHVNPIYLFTGEGAMFMQEEGLNAFRTLTIVTNEANEERIVHVPVPAQAGYAGELGNQAIFYDLPTFSLPDFRYKSGTHRSFDVSGDSMEPTLYEGDKVVCSFLEPDLWESSLKDNYVYVLVTRGDVLVKRVVNHIRRDNTLELRSDNDYYKPYSMPIQDVREIWYVRVKISPFLASPVSPNQVLQADLSDLRDVIREQNLLISDLQKTIREVFPLPIDYNHENR